MTKTTDNLKEAFAGESQANRKYLAYGQQAGKDGFPNVAKLFKAIAEAETIHALNHFRALGAVKSTAENLVDAQAGEHYEFTTMYPPMVEEAKAEGNKRATRSLHAAMEVEKLHYALYGDALEAVKAGKDLGNIVIHVCPTCGYTLIGDAPDACPICGCAGEKFIEFA